MLVVLFFISIFLLLFLLIVLLLSVIFKNSHLAITIICIYRESENLIYFILCFILVSTLSSNLLSCYCCRCCFCLCCRFLSPFFYFLTIHKYFQKYEQLMMNICRVRATLMISSLLCFSVLFCAVQQHQQYQLWRQTKQPPINLFSHLLFSNFRNYFYYSYFNVCSILCVCLCMRACVSARASAQV